MTRVVWSELLQEATFLDSGKKSVVVVFHFAKFDEVEGGIGALMGPEVDSDVAKRGFD